MDSAEHNAAVEQGECANRESRFLFWRVTLIAIREWRKRTWYGKLLMLPTLIVHAVMLVFAVPAELLVEGGKAASQWWDESSPPVYKEES